MLNIYNNSYNNSLATDYSLLKYTRTAKALQRDSVICDTARAIAQAQAVSGQDIHIQKIAQAFQRVIKGQDNNLHEIARAYSQAPQKQDLVIQNAARIIAQTRNDLQQDIAINDVRQVVSEIPHEAKKFDEILNQVSKSTCA